MECWGGIYGSEKRKESGEIGPAEKEYRDTEPAVCGVENLFFLDLYVFDTFLILSWATQGDSIIRGSGIYDLIRNTFIGEGSHNFDSSSFFPLNTISIKFLQETIESLHAMKSKR